MRLLWLAEFKDKTVGLAANFGVKDQEAVIVGRVAKDVAFSSSTKPAFLKSARRCSGRCDAVSDGIAGITWIGDMVDHDDGARLHRVINRL